MAWLLRHVSTDGVLVRDRKDRKIGVTPRSGRRKPRQPLAYGLEPPRGLFELADSVRDVIEKMVVIDQGHGALRVASREMRRIARSLEVIGRKGLRVRMRPGTDPGRDDLRPYYAGDATRWHYNPIFPPLQLVLDRSGVLRGRVTLGLPYEGPPGCVHGGIVSLLFDQLLGQVNLGNGLPAITGALSVTFRTPTPLLAELSLEAHPPENIEGRKYLTRGWIRRRGRVTAEAEGVFVLPDSENRPHFPHMPHAEAEQLDRVPPRRRRRR